MFSDEVRIGVSLHAGKGQRVSCMPEKSLRIRMAFFHERLGIGRRLRNSILAEPGKEKGSYTEPFKIGTKKYQRRRLWPPLLHKPAGFTNLQERMRPPPGVKILLARLFTSFPDYYRYF